MTDVNFDSIFPSLEAKAVQLNKLSNSVNTLLATIEGRLVKLNLGLEFWFDRPIETADSEGSSSFRSTRTKTIQVLGFTRIEGKWCLAIKPIRRESGFFEGDSNCPYQEDFADGPPVPLLQTSRAIRIISLKVMPDFLAMMQDSVAETVAGVETAVNLPATDKKASIHSHLRAMANELLDYIKEQEPSQSDRWVSAVDIKNALELNLVAVPKQGEQYGEKGWLFAILARILEDMDLVEYKKDGSRAFYRSKNL